MGINWSGVIDVHSHLGFLRGREYTAEETIRRMDRNGIERAIVLHYVSDLVERDDFRRANDYIKLAVDAYPERFIGMCIVSPVHGEFAIQEFERCLAIGFSGLKLHPAKHGPYSLRHEVVQKLLQRVEASGAVLFIHSDFNSAFCNPYEVVSLASSFPRAKVILGHFGMDPSRILLIPSIVQHAPNVFLDTSLTPDHPEAVFVTPIQKLGRGRVLFGSDSHPISPEVNLKKLEVAMDLYGLSEADARAIVRDNAMALLAGVPGIRTNRNVDR